MKFLFIRQCYYKNSCLNRSDENNRAIWKPGDISEMKEDGGRGSLRAKFELSGGPTNPGSIAAQFLCEGTTMSGIEFELVGTGYRTSLIKKRFVSGMKVGFGLVYSADAEHTFRYEKQILIMVWSCGV